MKEFGSNFQPIKAFDSNRAHLTDVFKGAYLLANGRQCIVTLIQQYCWKRIWLPEYFSRNVVKSIQDKTGIEVAYYVDSPVREGALETLKFEEGDVLLRMNYFGMRDLRRNKKLSVPVIEDHSHDPFGHWALYSDADWCISSIRKFLPLPEGGMMWSPQGHKLKIEVRQTDENIKIAQTRWEGMEKKARYLDGGNENKDEYLSIFSETEGLLIQSETSLIDERSKQFITKELDINLWLGAKRKNWKLLRSLINTEHCIIVEPEDDSCNMFSLVLLYENKELRDSIREYLVSKDVYPAVLWEIPIDSTTDAKNFSERMLSIHCDGRYTEKEVKSMAEIINGAINKVKNE